MTKFLLSISLAIASLVGLVVAFIAYILLSTPQPTDLRGCLTTQLFKVRLCPKDANYVRLRQISPLARAAVIVSEDGNFYSHQGFDWFEIRESFNKNWEKGEYARGGSTITQQLAKNVYLTAEKSLLRKVRELLITVQIEKMLSKDEILEKYLNVVEFGPGLYGIRRASQHYFGKHPAELNAAESAFLAFLLPSPKRYSISFKRQQLTPFARRQMLSIVKRMRALGKIDEMSHLEAVAQINNFFGPPEPIEPETLEAPIEEATPSPEELIEEEP